MKIPFELTLTGMAAGGKALGRYENRVIFVPWALPGERVRVQLREDKGRFALADLLEVIEPAPPRIAPRCRHFGVCGGCQWQHIAYDTQLALKQQIVIDQLTRIGGFKAPPVRPTLPSPDPWFYRTHATVQITPAGRAAFVGVEDQTLVTLEECPILRPELFDRVRQVPARGSRLRVQVGSPGQEKLIALATDEDHIQRVLTPVTAVHYQIKGKNFRVSGGSFFQVNLAQAEKLVDLVLDRLGLSGREVVLDLYSGVGLFSAFLVEQAAFCTAIELYAPAVMDARENLKHAANVQLITGTMEKALPTIKGQIDAVVIDPPRAGVKKAALDALLRLKPGQIIYVACDAGTLARDAKILAEQGYTLVDVQPLDMFPQTAHIEVVAHLRR